MATLIRNIWPASAVFGVPKAMRRSCSYEAYVPDNLVGRQLMLSPDTVADLQEAEEAIQQLNASEAALFSLQAIARLLLRAEALGSSRIEGLEMSARRLVRVEAARDLGQTAHRDVTAEAVLGNIEAMQMAVSDLADREKLSVDDVLALHVALMQHTTYSDLGGRIRTTQNWIGGNSYNPCAAEFVPPPPEYVPALLEDLVAYLNTEDHPPLIQAAMAHLQFETIHPFSDGNGRVGRALIHVVLRRRGLCERYVPPISLVLATRSRDYVNGMSTARYFGDANSIESMTAVSTWLSVFASSTARAARDAEVFGQQIAAMVSDWRKRVAPVRENSGVDLLLQALPAAPILTVATAAHLIGRSLQSTNSAIARLVSGGILKQVPGGTASWRRAFEARDLLDLFTNFERALASPTGDTRGNDPVRPVPARRQRHDRIIS